MGLLDRIKAIAGENQEHIQAAVDMAGNAVSDKTGGKFDDKIAMAHDAAAQAVTKFVPEVHEAAGDTGAGTEPEVAAEPSAAAEPEAAPE